MAVYLVDTNVLVRRLQRSSTHHDAARRALRTLYEQGHMLCVGSQILQEFWSVATRSAARGGFALTTDQTARHVMRIRRLFVHLPDTAGIYNELEALVTSLGITDADVFDARLVALMNVHSVSHILTFNGADFRVFSAITVVDPASL